ncbi:hypothetical protein F4703DRAFT_1796492 [Phycomyces blakesleeanus]
MQLVLDSTLYRVLFQYNAARTYTLGLSLFVANNGILTMDLRHEQVFILYNYLLELLNIITILNTIMRLVLLLLASSINFGISHASFEKRQSVQPIPIPGPNPGNRPVTLILESSAVTYLNFDENTKATMIFWQLQDYIEYDFYIEVSKSDGACISWDARFIKEGDGSPLSCESMKSVECETSISLDVCRVGPTGFGKCSSPIGKTGIDLKVYYDQRRIRIDSGRSTEFNLHPGDPLSIAGLSIVAAYSPKDNSSQKLACGIVQLGQGTFGNFTIGTSESENPEAPENSDVSGTTNDGRVNNITGITSVLLLVAMLYYVEF